MSGARGGAFDRFNLRFQLDQILRSRGQIGGSNFLPASCAGTGFGDVLHHRIADAQFVAGQNFDLVNLLAIDERAGARREIADVAPAIHFENNGVRGGDGLFKQMDVATVAPADEERFAVDGNGVFDAFNMDTAWGGGFDFGRGCADRSNGRLVIR